MAVAKYWDPGTLAWLPLLGQGGAPAAPAAPAPLGQPGTVVARGSIAIPDVNGSAPGWHNVLLALNGWWYPYTVQVSVVSGLYGGYGGSDVVAETDVYAVGPNAPAASAPAVHAHAAYWVPMPVVASWQCSPSMNCGFYVRYYFHSGSNFHTSGGANYTIVAV